MNFRLDPDLVREAKLTTAQVRALELYDGRDYGTRFVAVTLGISRSAARDRIDSGLEKIRRLQSGQPAA